MTSGLRLWYHRIYAMLFGYGFGPCPRCGLLYCYRFSRGLIWKDESHNWGKLTCCPSETVQRTLNE